MNHDAEPAVTVGRHGPGMVRRRGSVPETIRLARTIDELERLLAELGMALQRPNMVRALDALVEQEFLARDEGQYQFRVPFGAGLLPSKSPRACGSSRQSRSAGDAPRAPDEFGAERSSYHPVLRHRCVREATGRLNSGVTVEAFDQTLRKTSCRGLAVRLTGEGRRGPIVIDRGPIVIDRGPIVIDRGPIVIDRRPIVIDRRPIVIDRRPIVIDRGPIVIDRGPIVIDRRCIDALSVSALHA